MAETIVARSAIAPHAPQIVVAGWLVSGRRSDAALTLTDLGPLTKVSVRAADSGPMATALGTHLGQVTRDGGRLVTHAVPGEWLVLAAPGEQSSMLAWLEGLAADELVSMVDQTHGRALLRLRGARAADVLAKECAVDLGDRGCPDGRALRTAVAGLAVDVVRDGEAGVPSYLLHCERSSGQYLHECLLESGAELGIDVDGFRIETTGGT